MDGNDPCPQKHLLCVGGPLNRQRRLVSCTNGLDVADRDDRQPHVFPDGSVGWLCGVHHYHRRLFASKERVVELLVYVKYTPAPIDIKTLLAAGDLQEGVG